ncbi:unnamed protein product [Aureobasidium pullulans]|nr:unnamed protein product [Aureobasidium pullulans]
MSWRGQGITGSNNIPLGNRRRFGAEDGSPPVEESYSSGPVEGDSLKRGRSPVRGTFVARPIAAIRSPSSTELNPDGTKKRKKRNRWGDATDNKAAGLMNLPTAVLGNMTSEQLDAYTLHLRIEEISQKLRINDVVPADGDRSPSPPPQYDNFGRRVNTREYRYKKRLEEERHKLVEKAMKTIPGYHPPSDYRRPTKTQEKVYVPVNDYPEINFRFFPTNSWSTYWSSWQHPEKMETESGAKIAIRGKGSVKEGKGRSDAAHTSNQEEDLHCLIMADTEDKVNKAKQLIHNVIETAASIPEGQNELKRNQLRELAALNGTLRDDENQACQNCGQIGHRKYDCPEQRNFTANIICRVCGNAGHMARDCPDRQRGQDWRNSERGAPGAPRPAGALEPADTEFNNLMQELVLAAPLLEMPHLLASKPAVTVTTVEQPSPGSVDLQEDPLPGSKGWWRRWRWSRTRCSPSGGPAPWAAGGSGGGRVTDSYGGGYSGGQASGAAPWQQQQQPAAAPQAGYGGGYGGYGGYGYSGAPGYEQGYGQAAAPGMTPWQQQAYGAAGSPPPPPAGDAPPPPPPPSENPPPPPPSRQLKDEMWKQEQKSLAYVEK